MSLYYQVESIIDKRLNKKGKPEYKIKWKDYPFEECSWEPLSHLKNVLFGCIGDIVVALHLLIEHLSKTQAAFLGRLSGHLTYQSVGVIIFKSVHGRTVAFGSAGSLPHLLKALL